MRLQGCNASRVPMKHAEHPSVRAVEDSNLHVGASGYNLRRIHADLGDRCLVLLDKHDLFPLHGVPHKQVRIASSAVDVLVVEAERRDAQLVTLQGPDVVPVIPRKHVHQLPSVDIKDADAALNGANNELHAPSRRPCDLVNLLVGGIQGHASDELLLSHFLHQGALLDHQLLAELLSGGFHIGDTERNIRLHALCCFETLRNFLVSLCKPNLELLNVEDLLFLVNQRRSHGVLVSAPGFLQLGANRFEEGLNLRRFQLLFR
mmetsp:Transcript_17297/g.65923  ORF Transcript_17297/g.65923 Transcript_17297/m.65923 type:complete len:262 (-) Transcript_17297:2819-3604(-)